MTVPSVLFVNVKSVDVGLGWFVSPGPGKDMTPLPELPLNVAFPMMWPLSSSTTRSSAKRPLNLRETLEAFDGSVNDSFATQNPLNFFRLPPETNFPSISASFVRLISPAFSISTG